jgi:hypothetical protein
MPKIIGTGLGELECGPAEQLLRKYLVLGKLL